jgi:Xaa-Pro aminopeptidase
MLINLARARRIMTEHGMDAFFFRNPVNVTYASDFHNAGASMPSRPFAAVIFRDGSIQPLLVVPSVDFRLAKQMSWIEDVRAYIRAEKASDRDKNFYPDFSSAVQAGFQDRKATGIRLGYEEATLPVPFFEQLCSALPGYAWVPASEAINRVRAVKTAEEIRNLKRSAEITVKAHNSFREAIRIGATERDLALAAQVTMLREGADRVAFIYIGSNETRGYAHNPFPTEVPLKRGDFVKVDMGCHFRGYESDFVRSYILGKGTPRQLEVYKALAEGSMAIGTYLTPGRSCIDVYNWGFKFMNDRLPGYAREFLGHGIGLTPHEEPRLHEGNPMILEVGMVICIEHSFYLDGARYHFEDTFLIEESGAVCWTGELSRSLEVPV